MTVLVTGGAGYIGSHVVRELEQRTEVVVVDDLSSGSADRVRGHEVVVLDLADQSAPGRLQEVMSTRGVDAVVHLAARKQVGESVQRPAWYYQQNVGGLANVLLAMERAEVRELVFSSSAAVYGDVATGGRPVREDDPCQPVSPYGQTKLVGEWMCRAAGEAWDLRWTALRYFNVAGAATPELGDPAATNLIPLVLRAVVAGQRPQIFGADYDTPDGTCLRDYVHVQDLARAHIAALEHVGSAGYGTTSHREFNVGTGHGSSVSEVVSEIRRATGRTTDAEVVSRRPGDPASVVADPGRIRADLDWSAEHGLDEMVASAWRAWPHGHARVS
ncbi:UDP-glucose 4-epimerase GalE [Nocardioides conyzicola]|uniref:UDP-glucose 4-epimerase n=1 Tax=Nocardioides conyzicola TaxID=1651781 RepID=A0ABP8WTR7_9ACTN